MPSESTPELPGVERQEGKSVVPFPEWVLLVTAAFSGGCEGSPQKGWPGPS